VLRQAGQAGIAFQSSWPGNGGEEYRAALTKLETRYRIAFTAPGPVKLNPDEALRDIIRWMQKRAGQSEAQQKLAMALVKRLRRIREQVGDP
jgi:hypothetical protein